METQGKYYWDKAVGYYQKKYFGFALLFCSGEKIMKKAMEFAIKEKEKKQC